jgi:hypothetical protein
MLPSLPGMPSVLPRLLTVEPEASTHVFAAGAEQSSNTLEKGRLRLDMQACKPERGMWQAMT